MSGRDFNPSDVASRPKVVLISESMALRFWPGLNPIGQHLTLTFYPGTSREVVGVVADMKLLGLDVRDPVAAVYVPLAQVPRPVLSLAVRTAVPPTEVATCSPPRFGRWTRSSRCSRCSRWTAWSVNRWRSSVSACFS
jgi:hypothetical protein